MQAAYHGNPSLRTILLIEDNPADVVLTQEAFRTLGIDSPLQVCGRGTDALRYLSGLQSEASPQLPAAILLDLHLPDMDGLEVLRAIRATYDPAEVPVLIMSNAASPREWAACQQDHAAAYVEKTVDFDGFVRNIAGIRNYLCPQE